MKSPLDNLPIDADVVSRNRIALIHEIALDRIQEIIENDGFPSPSDGITVYRSDKHNSILNLPLMAAFWAEGKQYAVLNSAEDNLGDSDCMASNSMVFDLSEGQFLGSVDKVLKQLRIEINQESANAEQQIDSASAMKGQFAIKSLCKTMNATEQTRESLNTLYWGISAAFEGLLPVSSAADWAAQQRRHWESVAALPSSRPT